MHLCSLVYTKPLCVQCDATKRALNRAGIAYEIIDLTQDPDARAAVAARGFLQVPVVIADDDAWSGFRPDKLKQLA